MTDLQAAEAAHAAAAERHQQHTAAAHAARHAVRDAVAAKDALIHSAATGGTVTAADLRQAEDAARNADAEAAVADAVGQHARSDLARAEVALLTAQAAALLARVANTAGKQIDAAKALDAALAAAREAAAAYDAAAVEHAQATRDAFGHDQAVAVAARTNEVLAGQHASVHPRTRMAAIANPSAVVVEAHRTINWNGGTRQAVHDVEAMARGDLLPVLPRAAA